MSGDRRRSPTTWRRDSQVWLADLVEAVDSLSPDDRAVGHIIELLGLGTVPIAPPTEPEDRPRPNEAVETPNTDRLLEADETALRTATSAEPMLLSRIRRDTPPRSIVTQYPGETLDPVAEEHLGVAPPHTPLFPQVATAPIIELALATWVPGRRVDLHALVDALARKRPVLSVPRLPRRSLVRGVQVLIDIGPAMEPFHSDQQQLIADIEHLVGTESTAVRMYVDSPSRRSGDGPVGTWGPYEPPHPGTPVLVLGDFGIGRTPGGRREGIQEEWLAVARILARRRSPLVAFVPYATARWPARLADEIDLIEWDHTTSINDVAAAIGRHQHDHL